MGAAIVLAAGGSSRFGRANKLLQPLGDRTILSHVLAAAGAAPVGRLIVVTGADHVRIGQMARRACRRPLQIVHAPDWRCGVGSSLRAGIGALRRADVFAFIFLGDTPFVPPGIARHMLRRLAPGIDVVRAVHRGRPGHPVLVRVAALARLAFAGDRGLGPALACLNASRSRIIEAGPGAIRDIDRRADLVRARNILRQGDISPPIG